MNVITSSTIRAGEYPHTLATRAHTFATDISVADGGSDSAPGPHDYFDGALAACKAVTAMWYAKRHAIPLERIECRVERDDAEEKRGSYTLRVSIAFIGSLSDGQRAALQRAADSCPIAKLMTTADIKIETITS